MGPDARTTGFIQDNSGNFEDVGQIKLSDGYDRTNFQWTDVNRDGRADLVWVEKFSSDGYVWKVKLSDDTWRRCRIPGPLKAEFLGKSLLTVRCLILLRYNEKQGRPGEFLGSAFQWRQQAPPDKAYAGQAAGTCEHFVDIDGNGRADIHYILGTFTNEARTSLSPNCGLVDTEPGDDPYEPLPDPPLLES